MVLLRYKGIEGREARYSRHIITITATLAEPVGMSSTLLPLGSCHPPPLRSLYGRGSSSGPTKNRRGSAGAASHRTEPLLERGGRLAPTQNHALAWLRCLYRRV